MSNGARLELETPLPRRYGQRQGRAVIARFFEYLLVAPGDGCWTWRGTKNPSGYGQMDMRRADGIGRPVGAHRIAFAIANGYWPKETMHSCDNPSCVRPSHLRDGTRAENMRDCVTRGRFRGHAYLNARKTHCPKGHPYSGANLYVHKDGVRDCRTCRRASAERWAVARRTK